MLKRAGDKVVRTHGHYFPGISFIFLLMISSFYLAESKIFLQLGIGPVIVAIFVGMIAANSVHLSDSLKPGMTFVSKKILRLAVILLGFKISFLEVMNAGLLAFSADLFMVTTTLLLAIVVAKVIRMDLETGILIGFGSAICGASAVLAAEGVLQSKTYKASMAIATVTVFGTILMFAFPYLYNTGILGINATAYGIFVGSTVHEVGQVVAAGAAIGGSASDTAIITKLTRVLMLIPAIFAVLWYWSRVKHTQQKRAEDAPNKRNVPFPWFVLGFLLMVLVNTYIPFEKSITADILEVDKYLLVASMAAIGVQTKFQDFYRAGKKPMFLGIILTLWLAFGGFAFIKIFSWNTSSITRPPVYPGAFLIFANKVTDYFFSIFTNVSDGIETFPNCFIFFFPSFCFSNNFRFRVISPP